VNNETAHKQVSSPDINSNLMFSNDQDKIIYNSNSIDNNKYLIKSKSITGCLNKASLTKEVTDNVTSGHKRLRCNKNRINSISCGNEIHLNICDRSVADDDKGNEIIEDINDEFSKKTAARHSNRNRSNDTNRFSIENKFDNTLVLKNSDLIALKSVDTTINLTEKQTIDATISSSCSSTSNENNNEINVTKSDQTNEEKNIQNDTEWKFLNVNHKRNTNPFLNDFISKTTAAADGDEPTSSEPGANDMSVIENEIVKVILNNDENGRPFQSSLDRRLKILKSLQGSFCNDDCQEKSLLDSRGDSDELCNFETFEELQRSSSKQKISKNSKTPSNSRDKIKENLTSDFEIESPLDDPRFMMKSAIPSCLFERRDFYCPSQIINADCVLTREKKTFKFMKKSSALFNIPSFRKKSTLTLNHVNLDYPNKTLSSSVVERPNDTRYFVKFPAKAKYQLIKLGQKCKILSHQPPRIGNGRMTIIKTNTNHRQRYQHYNEINKSYKLDDFIRSTHLLSNAEEGHLCHNYEDYNPLDMDVGSDVNINEQQRSGPIYKNYKSEIDLTRNLTYLDTFLNENFEQNSPREESPNTKKNTRYKHKGLKSCSKNINYSNVIRRDQQSTTNMINDTNLNGIDESIDDDCRGRLFGDGNVTSSSFEYTAVPKEKKTREILQEIISGPTSSSLSSNDYASVYSGGSKETYESKLISTPEELVGYNDERLIEKQKKKQSQPIPEPNNSYLSEESEQFLLFDETNFLQIKNNMNKFHPDLYNSVPQFEDVNIIDFYENPQNCDFDTDTLVNSYAVESSTSNNRRQLLSSFKDRNSTHQDYLEHFQKQQLLTHHDHIRTDLNGYTMKNTFHRNIRPRTSTYSKHNKRENYNQSVGSANDLYDAQKLLQKSHSQSISPYVHPHRVIVSKSKRQKGEVVLEYEC
jgi:hypothetical protein